MHGCGAARSKGSFQATCHGTIYRQESQKGHSKLWRGCDLLVVEPGTWHPSILTNSACTCVALAYSRIWVVGIKRTEKKCSHPEGKIKTKFRKEQK